MFTIKTVFVLRIFGAILALSTSVMISRTLNMSEAGGVFFLLSVTGIISSLSSLGQNNLILKKCASVKYALKARGVFFLRCIKRSVISSIILSIILIPIIHYFSPQLLLRNTWCLAILLIISSSVNILLYSFLQSQGLVTFSVVLQYIFQPLLFIFFVLLIVLIKNESVLLVSLSYFFSIILIGGGGGVYSYYKFRDDFNQLETESIPFRLKELSEYFIGNSLGMLIVQSYVVLSGLLLPAADVAIIAVSDRISLVINLFAMSISTILAPKVASLYSQSKMNEIKELTKKAMFFIMIPCVLMALLFPFFSGLILSIFGVQYSNASEVLIILVMTQIINAIFCPVYVFLNMSDRQGFISKLHIYMLIPSLVITFYLTNIFGVVGVAVSKLIVVSLINIIPLIYCILLSNRVIK